MSDNKVVVEFIIKSFKFDNKVVLKTAIVVKLTGRIVLHMVVSDDLRLVRIAFREILFYNYVKYLHLHLKVRQRMKIVEATKDNLTEIMLFYNEMCEVLGQKSFLPNGNKGGFPSQAMVETAIKEGCQFIGIEDKKIVAAYILSHDCDDAYQSVH